MEEHDFRSAVEIVRRLQENIESVVRGKSHQIRLVLAAFACKGHVLFEDVPGTAKTVLSRAIAQSIGGATASRIQCTPDLQPTDVTGLSVFRPKIQDFEFLAGPVFSNILLVDEINRATPKTQSALLEAMAERQVTVDGVTRQLPEPFFLLATENPVEYEGTFPLPEAQLDRFLIKVELGYPPKDEELRILVDQQYGHPLEHVTAVVSLNEVRQLQDAVKAVHIDPLLRQGIVNIVHATRSLDTTLRLGASVRGSLALDRITRAWALVNEREEVWPDDVRELLVPVLGHRLIFDSAFQRSAGSLSNAVALCVEACLRVAPIPEPRT